MADRPDEELVKAALCGDVGCFMQLCHRYYPAALAIARAILHDRHLAEDAAQEALARACQNLKTLDHPSRFGAWLAAICRNQARDMLRRIPTTEALGDRDVQAATAEPDQELDLVREAIAQLPDESRELLYLKYDNDLSYREIADVLGISPEAVDGRLRRAKEAVRQYLELQQNRRVP